MPIPPIIHQIWIDESDWDCSSPPNGKGENSRTSFQSMSPNFQFVFWNLRKITQLFDLPHFAPFLDFFNSLKSIQKADVARIMIIFEFGGFYFDIKFINLKPLDPFLQYDMILMKDPLSSPFAEGVHNGVFASYPNNPVLFGLLKHIFQLYSPNICTFKTTGPNAWGAYLQSVGISKVLTPQYFVDYSLFGLSGLSMFGFGPSNGFTKLEHVSRSFWVYKELLPCTGYGLQVSGTSFLTFVLFYVILFILLKA